MAAVWIDIDNPPQVQYLYPFHEAFARRGLDVVVTVRRYGTAVELLRQRTSEFRVVGREFPAAKLTKAVGTLVRARELASIFRGTGRPDALVASSRSAALTAWMLGIPSFIFGDYEFANVSVYRFTRSLILVPDVIDTTALTARGLRREQLHPFHGLKEDITFAGVDLDAVAPWRLPSGTDRETALVLVRPAAEHSHYHDGRSSTLTLAALEFLAAQETATVIFAPRYPEQADVLERLSWRNEPVLLRESVPFAALLKAVDLVVCAGGTILREAAYLGIPAYSILRSGVGSVDRHLESLGRVEILLEPGELDRIRLVKRGPLERLDSNPQLLDEVATLVEASARAHASAGP